VDLSLSRSESYPRILAAVKAGARLLDIGCCFAQDIRKLVHDGAPGENLWGLEAEAEFIRLGYDFFRDKDRLNARFIVADFMDRSEPAVAAVCGTFGIVHLGMILHIWNRPAQLEACCRVVELLRPEPGVFVIGQCVGHLDGVPATGRGGKTMFKHNAETFRDLWTEVGQLTGTRWEVRAQLDEGLGIKEQSRKWDDPNTRRLAFEVERLADP
jgi:SAM-dependent methyltransferase